MGRDLLIDEGRKAAVTIVEVESTGVNLRMGLVHQNHSAQTDLAIVGRMILSNRKGLGIVVHMIRRNCPL